MALGPAEIHAQEHLGPIGRLGAARTRADRQDRGTLVVLAGEQQRGALAPEVGPQRGGVTLELGGEVGIRGLGQQLDRSLEVRGAREEAMPCLDLGSEPVGLAKDLLRGPLVIPELGLEGQRVELCDALLFGLEVKVAPRSTGSALRGRG
jgi:hypothetical protein